MAIFSKSSLKQSIRPIIAVVLISLIVFIWGRHRTVNVDLTLLPDISITETGTKLDMTVYRGETDSDAAASFSVPMTNRQARHRLSLAPGTYYMRGIVTTDAGKTHIVKQTIVIPQDDASIELFLRE